MYFKLITLTLALVVLGRAASVPDAAPKGATVEVVSVQDHSHLINPTVAHISNIAPSEKVALKSLSAATSPNSAFHALAGDLTSAIIVCSGQGCSGSCYYYNPFGFTPYRCYSVPGFLSAEVYSASGAGYNFGVYAALPGCADYVQLPYVNTCYNVFFRGVPTYFGAAFIAT
jgi:hypothetical protein